MSNKIAIFLFIFAVSLLYIHLPDRLNGTKQTDFPNYYFSGKRFWEGREIYIPLTPEVKNTIGIFHDAPIADTPFLVLVTSFLSFFPYHAASIFLLVLSTALFFITIKIFCETQHFTLQMKLLTMTIGLSSSSFIFLLLKNHIEVIVFFLSVLGFISFQRGKPCYTATLWGIASAIKLFPLLWLVCCVRSLGLKSSFFGVIIFILLSIIGFYFVGSQDSYRFLTEVVPGSRNYIGTVGNYSLVSFGAALYDIKLGWVLTIIGGVLISIRALTVNMSFGNAWIAAVCGSLILSPLSWLNYLILIIPALPYLFAFGVSTHAKLRLWVFLSSIVLWNFPEMLNTGEYYSTVLISFMPLYSLIFLFFLSTENRILPDKLIQDHIHS